MAPPPVQDEQYPPTWQQEIHRLKQTEQRLLENLSELQRRVSESDPVEIADRVTSLGEVLTCVEDSARQLVGVVQAFLRLQDEAIDQTRIQTLRQVQNEFDGLLQRLAQSSQREGTAGEA